MAAVGDMLRSAKVGAIYLVHGTFVGDDALGLLAELTRLCPAGRDVLGRLTKMLVDAVAGEVGNYTTEFASLFAESLRREGEPEIPVRLFRWSSENHHLGRADGAIRLIDHLTNLKLANGERILLWGHSHGGNLLALASNLLAVDREANRRFFEAARVYYRWPVTGWIDIPVWARAESMLNDGHNPLAGHPLDVVTFGTPVRYGWDPNGYARLMHLINHSPVPNIAPHLAVFPPTVDDVLRAAHGDYVQQIGIAGTNVIPTCFAPRAWLANRRLNDLLQPNLPARDLFERLKLGQRAPDAGTTLLADYGPLAGGLVSHLAGHAVYTKAEWLLFHAEEVARRFYAAG